MSVPRLLLLALTACALTVLPTQVEAGRAKPQWALTGTHEVTLDTGTLSLSGRFAFDVGDFDGSVTLGYAGAGTLAGSGQAGVSNEHIFTARGTWEPDAVSGRPLVELAMEGLTFSGLADETGTRLDGTHDRVPGFGFSNTSSSGPLSLVRVPPGPAATQFMLRLDVRQNKGGKITSTRQSVGRRSVPLPATLDVFGGVVLDGGRVKGRIRTAPDGASSGKVKVKGKKWSVLLEGPVDAAGFHATATVLTPDLEVSGVAVTLPVQAANLPPPPPPDPVPKNQLSGGIARILGDQVELVHGAVPRRFFGSKGELTIQFPGDAGPGVVNAVPETASILRPIRCFVRLGKKTYGTATAPADVRLDIVEFSNIPGATIRVHATGAMYTPQGKRKKVDVLLVARVL